MFSVPSKPVENLDKVCEDYEQNGFIEMSWQ